jgi:hypothetical protein
MADNTPITAGSGTNIAADEATYSGDTAKIQVIRQVHVSGTEGSKTVTEIANTNGLYSQGNIAHDIADAGNPVKIGGKAETTIPAPVADGDRVDAWFRATGEQVIYPGNVYDEAGADGVNNAFLIATEEVGGAGGALKVAGWVYNGGTWDRARGNTEGAFAQGNIAHDIADAGNPVKIGGKVGSSVNPTGVATGDRVDAHFDTKGRQVVVIASGYDGTGAVTGNTPVDDFTATAGINAQAMQSVFDGTTWDRARSVESVSAAPNVDTGIQAVGVGPGFDRKTNPTGVAATSTSNAVEVLVNGADSITFHVTTIGTTPGSMIFQTSGDDTAWATAGSVVKLGSTETFVEGAFVPAVDDVYLVRTTGVRRVRYKANAVYASGTATVKVTASVGSPIIKVVEMHPAPHKTGYTPFNLSEAVTTTAQTSVAINAAPGNADNAVTSTQRAVVTSIQIQASGTVAMTQFTVYFGTGAFSRGTNRVIFDGEFAPSSTSKPGVTMNFPVNPPIGAADEEVRMTTVGAGSFVINVWGYLIAA